MENFTKVRDAEEPGVGRVVRNIALPITILKQANDIRMQKIIITPFAAKKRLDLNKKTIVLEVIAVIAENAGNKMKIFLVIRNERWCKHRSTLHIQ
jgi:hypothetical protein